MRRTLVSVGIVLATALTSAQQGAPKNGEWTRYSSDSGSIKYAPLDQINKENVKNLRVAWRRPAVDASISSKNAEFSYSTNFRSTPLMIGGVLYASNGVGLVEAFSPATGKTVWIQEPFPDEPGQGLRGDSARGLAYWADGNERRLYTIRGEYLVALDLRTGKPVASFGEAGRVNLRPGLGPKANVYGWTGVPQICRDVVMVGVGIGGGMPDRAARKEGIPGVVQAFDVRTGKPRWKFNPIPHPGEVGSDTWEADSWAYSGNANLWSLISADEELGLVYLPMTAPTSDMYGGHRLGDNLFSTSLVCVRCLTGERVWHFQTSHHDLWDYDLPAAPILVDIRVNGRAIKAVVQLTKQAFAFVFDRTNGRPVWPIEERPVPQSDTPGERTSPTQPFPTKPPAFDRQGVSIDDLIDFTPALRTEAVGLLKYYRIGPLFTPPTVRGEGPDAVRGTIELPGSVGGADWQGGAFDPETSLLYVPSITGPFTADIVKGDPKRTDLNYLSGTRAWTPGPQGLPLLKPPYGRITAIDLNKGEQVWMVPNGEGPRNHPLLKSLNLPYLGNTGRAAPLATKTLLFVGEGSNVMSALGERLRPEMNPDLVPGAGGKKFRAYDKATGATLAQIDLPQGTTGAPMTYMFEGKQYVVVAIGGSEPKSAEFVALSLP